MTSPDTDAAVERYIALTEQKRKIEADLRPVKAELAELDQQIVAAFRDRDRQAETRLGYTVHLIRDVSVKPRSGDTGDIVDKLRRARLGELIGISHPKLKAWVKERLYNADTDTWEVDLGKLPPSIRDVVQVDEYYRLGCRKA